MRLSELVFCLSILGNVATLWLYLMWRGHQRSPEQHNAAFDGFKRRVASEWHLFHGRYKFDEGMSDEAILTRFVFIQLDARLLGPELQPFVVTLGPRGMILAAIAEAHEASRVDAHKLAREIDAAPRTRAPRKLSEP